MMGQDPQLNPAEFAPPSGGASGGANPLEGIMAAAQQIMQICTDLATAMQAQTQAPAPGGVPAPAPGPAMPTE